jgi:hypothetical protein
MANAAKHAMAVMVSIFFIVFIRFMGVNNIEVTPFFTFCLAMFALFVRFCVPLRGFLRDNRQRTTDYRRKMEVLFRVVSFWMDSFVRCLLPVVKI